MQKNLSVNGWQRLKQGLMPILLLFWLSCLPLALSIYTPYLYQTNCHWNKRCAQLGEKQSERRIGELNRFFLHHNETLSWPWTEKENLHMREVRRIYDVVFVLFLLTTFIFIADFSLAANNRKHYRHYARNSLLISVLLVVFALLMIPFFTLFWAHVFHPLMFDNNLWKTNPNDVSWYLMPKTFFLRAIIFITLATLLLNLVLWHLCRAAKTRTRPDET